MLNYDRKHSKRLNSAVNMFSMILVIKSCVQLILGKHPQEYLNAVACFLFTRLAIGIVTRRKCKKYH